MPDDLLLAAALCEAGERVLALRTVLTEPSVAILLPSRAVASTLIYAIDAVEARLERVVRAARTSAAGLSPTTRVDLAATGQALQAVHARLGLLAGRVDAAAVDIFLHMLRDDLDAAGPEAVAAMLPTPLVVLSDHEAMARDVVLDLRRDLAGTDEASQGDLDGDAHVVLSLPRGDAADPLRWPLLLRPFARAYLRRQSRARAWPLLGGDAAVEGATAVYLGGPAVFTAHVAHDALAPRSMNEDPRLLGAMRTAARLYVRGRALSSERSGRENGDDVDDLFTHLAWGESDAPDDGFPDEADLMRLALLLPRPVTAMEAEKDALFAKLSAGTPINAVEPPPRADLTQALDAMTDASDFYALIATVGERPAALCTMLEVGWRYKARVSYRLFGDLLRDEDAFTPALAAYKPHLTQRNDVLVQSIEAAYVHRIFGRSAPIEPEQ